MFYTDMESVFINDKAFRQSSVKRDESYWYIIVTNDSIAFAVNTKALLQ